MSGEITLFRSAIGMNNVQEPERLAKGSKDNPGHVELAMISNMSIDDRGLLTLREGDTLGMPGSFHSGFSYQGDAFVVQDRTSDAALMRVVTVSDTVVTLAGVRSPLTKGRRVSFTQVNEDTFYSNGVENGYIRAGASYTWPVSTYNGPETKLNFTGAPIGNHVAFVPGGLMLVAEGPHLWICHEPFAFGLFNKKSGLVDFASNIRMVCPVPAGVFVSDQKATWLLKGTSWFDYVQIKVADYPAVEWSLAHDHVSVRDQLGIELDGIGRIWASEKGVCVGMDNGMFLNLTQENYTYQAVSRPGACLIKGMSVIHTVSA